MSTPYPWYLSTSRSAPLLWALTAIGCITTLSLALPTLRVALLITWLLLQIAHYLAIKWMQKKDATRVTTATDLTLESTATDKAVMLVHGFVDLPFAWERQANVLAQKGYAVYIPHLDHEVPNAWLQTLQTHLSQLCSRYKHVELWGHSMGGALSLALAPHFPLKRVVLWAPFLAPYLTRPLTALIYILHRLLFLGQRTFTFFPSHRRGKGKPSTSYTVNCTLPLQTVATMLQTQYHACAAAPTSPRTFILSSRERVISNAAILAHFPNDTILWAAHPSSGHQLTNTDDWLKNLNRVLKVN